MIKKLLSAVESTIWLNTVNKYKLWQARQKLEQYVQTLSPEKQAWARELRAQLDAAEPGEDVKILRRENDKLAEKHARLTERLDRLARG